MPFIDVIDNKPSNIHSETKLLFISLARHLTLHVTADSFGTESGI